MLFQLWRLELKVHNRKAKCTGRHICVCCYTGNIGQFPTWVKLGSNLGNNNSQLLKLGFSWGKVGFYFES